MDTIRTMGKNGVELVEYKGEYSLIASYEGTGGKFWQKWGKERVGKDSYSDKDRPIKCVLGDKTTAAATCLLILQELTGATWAQQ